MTPERQVLYAIVSAAFHVVVGVLVVAAAGLVSTPWTVVMGVMWLAVGVIGVRSWRRTGLLLAMTIGLFILWTVGTLLFRK